MERNLNHTLNAKQFNKSDLGSRMPYKIKVT